MQYKWIALRVTTVGTLMANIGNWIVNIDLAIRLVATAISPHYFSQ